MKVLNLQCQTKGEPITSPVTILGSNYAHIYVSGTWFFESGNTDQLINAIQSVLNRAPYLGGSMQFRKYRPFSGSRYNRLMYTELAYNYQDDPGMIVEIDEESHASVTLSELLNQTETENDRVKKPIDIDAFLCRPPRNRKDDQPFKRGVMTKVKITRMAEGAFAVGLTASHALVDASSLFMIMSCFTRVYEGESLDIPLYVPSEMDDACMQPGNSKEDLVMEEEQVTWYDTWTSELAMPGMMGSFMRAIENFSGFAHPFTLKLEKSYIFQFSYEQIESIYHKAQSQCDSKISHLDALTGAFWDLAVRARRLGNKEVQLVQSVGIRNRLTSDDRFANHIGAFVLPFQLNIGGNSTPVEKAVKVRQEINRYCSKKAISQYCKRLSSVISPLRYLRYSCEEQITMSTSWIRNVEYPTKIDGKDAMYFSTGLRPMDGVMLFFSDGYGRDWYKSGASIVYSAPQHVLHEMVCQLES